MRILQIEDDESIRSFVKDAIKSNKSFSEEVTYIEVETAEQGIKEIKKGKTDLILLDLKLTGKMQGKELLSKLAPKTRVIVITASPQSIKEELTKKHPKLIIKILLKPFNLEKLINKIKEEITNKKINSVAGMKK